MRNIFVSVNDKKGNLNKFFNQCIGAGRAGEIMRYIPSEQLKESVKECGFRYIRFHGIFHEEMNICYRDGDGNLVFNYQYVDLLFDFFREIGLKPFLELGFMPKCMASGTQNLFWWDANVTPPERQEEWAKFITDFVRHLTLRYGEQEVKTWFFEVWNEPNYPSFFSEYEHIDEYFKLYKTTVEAIKAVNKDYQVGGPASSGMTWLKETADYCRENNVPIDFLSTHNYGCKGVFDEYGTAITILSERNEMFNETYKLGTLIAKDAGLPLHLTEWNTSYSPRDPIHDSYVNGALVLDTVKQFEGACDTFSYWTYTDIFEELAPPPTPFHGGFGLINTQSIKKPAYHAYRFLNALGDTELNCNDKYSYTCRSENEVQVLFWDYSNDEQNDVPDKDYFGRVFPPKKKDDTVVTISGLTPGEHTVTVETVGFGKGDAYSAYLKEDDSMLESIDTLECIQKASIPPLSTFKAVAESNGVCTLNFDLMENEFHLVRVSL